jgi:uncharacterized membrane protein YfcA
VIGAGFTSQLRAPEHAAAGLHQTVIGLIALAVAGWLGDRVEPLTGGAVSLLACPPLVALHPARRQLLAKGEVNVPLAAVVAAGSLPGLA